MDLLVLIDEDDAHLLTESTLGDEGSWDYVEANVLGLTLRANVDKVISVEVEKVP